MTYPIKLQGDPMKSKTYRGGKTSGRSYCKNVGNGWEVGFVFGGRTTFVGNFIHSAEANQWYARMNREIRSFAKRYTVGTNCPKTWYAHFLSNHLYKTYYTVVNRNLAQHNRKYNRATTTDVRTYRRLNRNWSNKTTFLKAA